MEFRPWMLEAAFNFVRSSRLLWKNNLSAPAMVNASIGLEILFKSFNASIDGKPGGVGEKYVAADRGHNLLTLFDAIPKPVQEQLGFRHYRTYFEGAAANLFVLARYPYESGGIDGGTSVLVEIAEEMVNRVIREYKNGGCNDPWVNAFSDV